MEIDAQEFAAFQAFQAAEADRKAKRMADQWVQWAEEVGGDVQNILRAYNMAEVLMAQHGVDAWTLRVGHGRREAGSARSLVKFGLFSEPGVITLSGPLMSLWDEDQQRQIILHEIAHALTGPKHDRFWILACSRLGIPALRCWGEDGEARAPRKSKPRWSGICPAGHPSKRVKRPAQGARYSCGVCTPGRFDENAVITWKKNPE